MQLCPAGLPVQTVLWPAERRINRSDPERAEKHAVLCVKDPLLVQL